MAQNWTPEQLKQIQDYYIVGNSGYSPSMTTPMQMGGQYIQAQRVGNETANSGGISPVTHYTAYDQSWADGGDHTGEFGQSFDTQGNYIKDFAFQQTPWYQNAIIPALAAVGMGAFLPGGALGGAAGGAGAAGSELAAAEMAAGAGLGPGAALGAEGVAAYTALPTVSLDAMAGAMGMTPEAFTALGSGASLNGGGLLDSVTKALGGKKALGVASTVLGALGGAQGEEESETSEKKMDPRLDAYVFGGDGRKGLLNYADELLARQMSPEYMAGADRMREIGLGLLGTGVRPGNLGGSILGNGFDNFRRGGGLLGSIGERF